MRCNRPFKLIHFGKSVSQLNENHVTTRGYSKGDEVNWFFRNSLDSQTITYPCTSKFKIEERIARNMCNPKSHSTNHIFGFHLYALEENAHVLKNCVKEINLSPGWQHAMSLSQKKIKLQQANWTLMNTYARMGIAEGINQIASMVGDFNQECLKGEHPLLAAIQYHQYDALKALLDGGADPNINIGNDFTPLTLAISLKDEICVRILLENGANPNFQLPGDAPALFYAAEYRNLNVVEQLVANQADPTLTYSVSTEQLMKIAKSAHIEKIMLEFIESKKPFSSEKIAIRPDEIAKIMGYQEIYSVLSIHYFQYSEKPAPVIKLTKTGLGFWQEEQAAVNNEITVALMELNQ